MCAFSAHKNAPSTSASTANISVLSGGLSSTVAAPANRNPPVTLISAPPSKVTGRDSNIIADALDRDVRICLQTTTIHVSPAPSPAPGPATNAAAVAGGHQYHQQATYSGTFHPHSSVRVTPTPLTSSQASLYFPIFHCQNASTIPKSYGVYVILK